MEVIDSPLCPMLWLFINDFVQICIFLTSPFFSWLLLFSPDSHYMHGIGVKVAIKYQKCPQLNSAYECRKNY